MADKRLQEYQMSSLSCLDSSFSPEHTAYINTARVTWPQALWSVWGVEGINTARFAVGVSSFPNTGSDFRNRENPTNNHTHPHSERPSQCAKSKI